jgi:hypothetical protein
MYTVLGFNLQNLQTCSGGNSKFNLTYYENIVKTTRSRLEQKTILVRLETE